MPFLYYRRIKQYTRINFNKDVLVPTTFKYYSILALFIAVTSHMWLFTACNVHSLQ